jgi:endo-1,4-beta-D-glucanase Y
MLGLQLSMYPQFTNASAFDIWIDNIQFVADDSGLATFSPTPAPMKPFPRDAAVGTCTKPTGAAGKFLVDAYLHWKTTFVTGTGNSTRVQRPENGNDTVSEGIAYGMLIAAMMGDKTLFDGLWGYWSTHGIGGANGMLMNWTCPGGSSCSGGSATDADEDAAYALLLASKQFGGSPTGSSTTYLSLAQMMIPQIWNGEIDATALLPRGGNNYPNVSSAATNPSYFAPAYYRIFAMIDMATGHNWSGVADRVYTPLNAAALNKGGLLPAWCVSNCTVQGSNTNPPDDALYQYDAHRIPWRVGLDACWNGTAAAKTFLMGNAAFFVRKAANGIGNVFDRYSLDGNPAVSSTPAPQRNSMSAIGTAGVGAMGAGSADFANRAYKFILDANYTADPPTKMTAYTYFNATVGLLTALTMSGNFPDYRTF